MAGLPPQYAYLEREPLPPKMVKEALKMLGTIEIPGARSNTVIVDWADEVATTCGGTYAQWAADFYNKDSIPWCGLFCAVVAARTCDGRQDRMPPKNYLAALAWANWGEAASSDDIRVGDVVVLVREGGGHVFIALGVSVDAKSIIGIGGNQGDAVTIAAFESSRLYAVRRPIYRQTPPGACRVVLEHHGSYSVREA